MESTKLLIGILLDVSGSMKRSIGDGIDQEGGAWAKSIFSVIDNLIKHDLSPDNYVFALGFGAIQEPIKFDLIGSLEEIRKVTQYQQMSLEEIVERILELLETGGAKTVRQWAPMDILMRTLLAYKDTCTAVLLKLESDEYFLKSFVEDILPPACRDPFRREPGIFGQIKECIVSIFVSWETREKVNRVYNTFASGASYVRTATEDDIREVVNKAERKLREKQDSILKGVGMKYTWGSRYNATAIHSVHTAHSILRGCVGGKELTKERVQKLLEIVEPYIYGGTPLLEALRMSADLFESSLYRDHKKLLFVLSDGQPTDGFFKCGYLASSMFKNKDVTVVSCFITTSTTVVPCKLYSTVDREWDPGATFMFRLSSIISTQLLPRTIFVRRGWNIDTQNNETKLFLQVNHPDHLKDACNLAHDVVTCQDALSDVLSLVSLDIYINQSTTGFGAKKQIGGTCYANASAAVLHLAMKRILGREGGYPEFKMLRDQMIDSYGRYGADTRRVLQEICPRYRLQCQSVDIKGAMRAITAKRPVVARFRLTDQEWDDFGKFFDENPKAVLTRNDIDNCKRQPGVQTGGHAVVLTSYNSTCLRFMNSWGSKWADNGFFNVQNVAVLGLEFFDVFWTLDDLTNNEKAYYDEHGSEVAATFVSKLTSLQVAEFQCPLCHSTSKVTQFTGQLTRASCPVCRGEFQCGKAGNILALNLYLTSLCKI